VHSVLLLQHCIISTGVCQLYVKVVHIDTVAPPRGWAGPDGCLAAGWVPRADSEGAPAQGALCLLAAARHFQAGSGTVARGARRPRAQLLGRLLWLVGRLAGGSCCVKGKPLCRCNRGQHRGVCWLLPSLGVCVYGLLVAGQ